MFAELKKWSHQNYSHLPWRVKRSLYNTLVSEVMLQQTTVSTVLNHFERFISKYPDIQTLAKASEEEMLIDWKGLGYYRRARNLLNAAKEIETKFQGEIPLDFKSLVSIKGIGEYTANAIISIGANKEAIALDANLERVIARIYGLETEKGPKLLKAIYHDFRAGKICQEINKIGPRDYNESLMDLGRSLCKARSTNCSLCPLKKNCVAFNENKTHLIPKLVDKKNIISGIELKLLRVIVEEEGKVLAYRKNQKEWLAGQLEIPTFVLDTEDLEFNQYPHLKIDDSIYHLPSFKTGITKYKITNYVLHASKKELSEIADKEYGWVGVDNKNFSTSTYKAFNI